MKISFETLRTIINNPETITTPQDDLIRRAHQHIINESLDQFNYAQNRYEIMHGRELPKIEKQDLEFLCGVPGVDFAAGSLSNIIPAMAWKFFVSYLDKLNRQIGILKRDIPEIDEGEESKEAVDMASGDQEEIIILSPLSDFPDLADIDLDLDLFNPELPQLIYDITKLSRKRSNKMAKPFVEEILKRAIAFSGRSSDILGVPASKMLFLKMLNKFSGVKNFFNRRFWNSIANNTISIN